MSLREIRRMDLAAVTGALIQAVQEAAAAAGVDPKEVPVRIDVSGGLGAGPADLLKSEGYAVRGINSSSAARDPEIYPNVRSDLWFVLRERARTRDLDLSRLSGELRADLIRELSTPKWKPDARGRKVVEPKADIKKRLGASPDLADAVNLSFFVHRPTAALVPLTAELLDPAPPLGPSEERHRAAAKAAADAARREAEIWAGMDPETLGHMQAVLGGGW